MKTEDPFSVDFNYTLSEDITVNLTANVDIQHSIPHYLVTKFHFKNNPGRNALLPDIDIVAIQNDNEISWVHFDSRKETELSIAVGRAIEASGRVEIANK